MTTFGLTLICVAGSHLFTWRKSRSGLPHSFKDAQQEFGNFERAIVAYARVLWTSQVRTGTYAKGMAAALAPV